MIGKPKCPKETGRSHMARTQKRVIEREAQKAKREHLERLFELQLSSSPICDGFSKQVRFHLTRRWRFDFAWTDCKLAAEIDGGTWSGGRHVTGKGHQQDAEKANAAIELGWHVLRFDSGAVKSGRALEQVERVIKQKRG